MSIKHRVFTLSYKRKSSKITKNKQTYKKFTGITTLALYKPQRTEVRQKYIKAKPKNIKPFTLKPHTINGFRAKIIENEYKFARNDIDKFKDYVSPQVAKSLKEFKSFKAFLPKHIWEKMSHNERKTHLKKRRELQARGLVIKDKNKKGRLKISKNIVKFSHRLARPVLNSLKFAERRNYLKSLVQTAKFIANNTFEDKGKKKRLTMRKPTLSSKEVIKVSLSGIKKYLNNGKIKVARKKQQLRNVTYLSLFGKKSTNKI